MQNISSDLSSLFEGLTKLKFDSDLSPSFNAVSTALWYRYPLN